MRALPGAVAAFACNYCLLAAIGQENELPLRFEPERPTFGLIETQDGTDRELLVRVVNTGSTSVRMDRVYVGCGCMSAARTSETAELAPGETGTIRVTLLAQKVVPGAESYRLGILQAEKPIGVTNVSYEYKPRVRSSASELVFGEVQPDGSQVASATLTVRIPEKLLLIKVLSSHPDVVATLGPVDSRRSMVQVTARLVPTAKFGPLVGSLTVLSDDPRHPEAVIPFRGVREPPVSIDPSTLIFRGDRATTQRRTVRLIGLADAQVARVASSSPLVTAQQQSDGKSWEVAIAGRGDAEEVVEAVLTFHFDSPSPFELQLRVVGE